MSGEVLDGILNGLLVAVMIWGTIGIGVMWYRACERMREPWGRVPVIDPVWWRIRDGIEWVMLLPGRALRWVRPRDTPRGLGGP